MELLTNFPLFWKIASIIVAGISAALSIFWEVRDKRTKRITGWGRIFLSITVISMLGALLAQVLEAKETDAHNRKAQEETLQLLAGTRQSIIELSRLLQPLENATVTVFFKLSCKSRAYEAFCSSANAQAKRAYQKLGEKLPAGSGFGNADLFDWGKWPHRHGPTTVIALHLFKTVEKIPGICKWGLSYIAPTRAINT